MFDLNNCNLSNYYSDKISIFHSSKEVVLKQKIYEVLKNVEKLPSGSFIQFVHRRFKLSPYYTDSIYTLETLSNPVIWQILHAAKFHYNQADSLTLNYGPEFGFYHLNEYNLIKLFVVFQSFVSHEINDPHIKIFRSVTFDIRDRILRICIENPEKGKIALSVLEKEHSPELEETKEMMRRVLNPHLFQPIFHPICSKSNGAFRSIADTKILVKSKKIEDEGCEVDLLTRKLKVWRVALENSKDNIGGISSVLTASFQAHRKMNFDTVQSIHPLYCHNKTLTGLKFKGVVEHEFFGKIVKSSIYKNKATGEYFIQPDPRYQGIFDVGESKCIYQGFTYSCREDRLSYLSSAAAAAVSTYSGKNGTKSVDVFQCEGWHATPAFDLMDQYYDQMRKESGLSRISRVLVTHMLVADKAEQGLLPSNLYGKMGINTPFPVSVNLTDRALRLSHANVFVSKGLTDDALSYDPALSKNLREASYSGGPLKIRAIRNGINSAAFDVTNPDSYEAYVTKNNEFLGAQDKIKRTLYDAGVLACPEKPLVLFVGRYSYEKGISMLPPAVEEIKKQGGQMVIMGLPCDDQNSLAIIKELEQLSKTDAYKDFLRVYTKREDQMDPFVFNNPNCKVRKGWLIRQAASMVLVPSFSEACGLVPMELQCAGAITIAPTVQGLKDTIISIDPNNPKKTFSNPKFLTNGVSYQNPFDPDDLRKAVSLAFFEYNGLTSDEKNSLMKRIRLHAVNNYDWVVERNNLIVGGSAYEYSRLYHDLTHAVENNPEVETFAQAALRQMPSN